MFYKTVWLDKWEELDSTEIMFNELTAEVNIFLCYLDKDDAEEFRKVYGKVPKDISEINLGDELVYTDTVKGVKVEKNMLFMGKDSEGKIILHMPGESYIYDISLIEATMNKKCVLARSKNPVDELKMKNKRELEMLGL